MLVRASVSICVAGQVSNSSPDVWGEPELYGEVREMHSSALMMAASLFVLGSSRISTVSSFGSNILYTTVITFA